MTIAIYRVGWMLFLNVWFIETTAAVATATRWLLYPAVVAFITCVGLAYQADKAGRDVA